MIICVLTQINAPAKSVKPKQDQNSQNKRERKCLIDWSTEGTHDRMNEVGERNEKKERRHPVEKGGDFPQHRWKPLVRCCSLKTFHVFAVIR